ncbi:MAG TPA: acyl carrier protein [Gammaproteobacteria bacterium]|nr:acyl carrier protein [Gammaproteobacteria bacterium]
MKDYEEILAALCEVLQPFAQGKSATLGEDTALVADLEIDSVKLLELLMEIEDRFDVSVPLNVLPDVETVRDLALKLQELMS